MKLVLKRKQTAFTKSFPLRDEKPSGLHLKINDKYLELTDDKSKATPPYLKVNGKYVREKFTPILKIVLERIEEYYGSSSPFSIYDIFASSSIEVEGDDELQDGILQNIDMAPPRTLYGGEIKLSNPFFTRVGRYDEWVNVKSIVGEVGSMETANEYLPIFLSLFNNSLVEIIDLTINNRDFFVLNFHVLTIGGPLLRTLRLSFKEGIRHYESLKIKAPQLKELSFSRMNDDNCLLYMSDETVKSLDTIKLLNVEDGTFRYMLHSFYQQALKVDGVVTKRRTVYFSDTMNTTEEELREDFPKFNFVRVPLSI